MPAAKPSKPASSSIPLNTWLLHRHSQNLFKVARIHALYVDTYADDLGTGPKQTGYANRFMLEAMIQRKTVIVDDP